MSNEMILLGLNVCSWLFVVVAIVCFVTALYAFYMRHIKLGFKGLLLSLVVVIYYYGSVVLIHLIAKSL